MKQYLFFGCYKKTEENIMKRIKKNPGYEMPREKMLEKGPSFLSNEELIAVILGNGTKKQNVFQLSKKVKEYLEEHFIELGKDYSSFIKGLCSIVGIGKARALLIIASIELVSRYINRESVIVKSARDILPLVGFLATKKQEYFMCISLNGGNRVISSRIITIGIADQALVHPREVFTEAVRERASKIIVAHNHPSNGLSPSEEDIQTTKNLVQAAGILGIGFLDHIIVSTNGYFSFREEGLL